MADQFSSDVLARLQERADNAERRTGVDEMVANSEAVDETLASMPKSSDLEVRHYLEGMNTPLAGMVANAVTGDGGQARGLFGLLGRALGGKSKLGMMAGVDHRPDFVSFGDGARRSEHAPRRCDESQVTAAEAGLGFALPGDLRQFYLEVANGGVGPADGLYSLDALLAKWREFTSEPIGPRGQKWPKELLPIHGPNWDVTCIHLHNGKLLYWDVEEIDYGGWEKSFKDEADSLEAWLNKWLNQGSLANAAQRQRIPEPQQLTDEDWQAWGEASPENREYLRRLDFFTMTATERSAHGLPEHGWEDRVWDGFDITRIEPPLPGFAKRAG